MWMQPYMPAPYLGLGACFAKKGDAASAHRFYGEVRPCRSLARSSGN